MTDDPMSRCPRFNRCSAPLCPLDPNREDRSHLRGEPVCGYLREIVKPDGASLVQQSVPELFELIAAAATELTVPGSPIYWALRAAARQNSQLASGRALHTRRQSAADIAEVSPSDSPTTDPNAGLLGISP